MHSKEAITYIALVIPFVGMVVGVLVVYFMGRTSQAERAMLHRERLAAIEKGLDVPLFDLREPQHRTSPLRSALVMLASGIALSVPVLHYGPGAWMWGLWLALIGLAQLGHWFAGGRREWEEEQALDRDLRQAYVERLRSIRTPAAPGPSAVA